MLSRRVAVPAFLSLFGVLRAQSAQASPSAPVHHGITPFPQTSTCSPQYPSDGGNPPHSVPPGCLCDPGQLRMMPPSQVPFVYDETTTFGEIWFQGLDCQWYRLPCPP